MSLSGKARLAGVLGWPVSHSRSPRLHGYWLNRYGIDGAYVPLAVRPDDLGDVVRALPKMGFRGANVTVPHKEAVMDLVDVVDPLAKRIGAVNTLVFEDNGQIVGRNTDAFGFFENLRAGAPNWSPSQGPALVLGAGGAARAVVAALLDGGVQEVLIANRTIAKAQAIADEMQGNIRVVDWSKRNRSLGDLGLLVNTTTLGMSGQPPLEMDLTGLSAKALVNDIVYAPLETNLLAQAKARGNPVVDGIGMLLHQARPGFAAWFGKDPEVTVELRDFVLGDGN